jgi:hypothetical protein
MKTKIKPEDWIYLYSEIASVMQEKFALDPIWEEYKEEDGVIHERRTPDADDQFCDICSDVEEIMCDVLEKAEL